jgi:nitrite transporter NirC
MDTDPFAKALTSATKKLDFLNRSFLRYSLSSLQAGVYLTIVGVVFWTMRESFDGAPLGRLISSLFFGVGLSTIVFTGTELFTSNNFYLAVSSLMKKTRWSDALRLWSVCWIGNFAGAILIALLLWGAGLVDLAPNHALMAGARHKIEMPANEIFFKGFLANWVVCLAVWVNLHLKEDIARFAAIILIVFIFLYLGFEHSIANMGVFAIAFMADSSFPLTGAAHNLVWSTLGNIVGGALGMGGVVWLMQETKPA